MRLQCFRLSHDRGLIQVNPHQLVDCASPQITIAQCIGIVCLAVPFLAFALPRYQVVETYMISMLFQNLLIDALVC